jgi:chromosome segregation ATPase
VPRVPPKLEVSRAISRFACYLQALPPSIRGFEAISQRIAGRHSRAVLRRTTKREGDKSGSDRDAFDLSISLLAEWLGKIRAKVEKFDSEKAGWNAGLERATAVLAKQWSEITAIRERISAIHVELERVQRRDISVTEDERRTFTQEIGLRFASERELSEHRLELLGVEIEELRRQNVELSRCRVEAKNHSLNLEVRLGLLEDASPRSLEQFDHFRERFRALEEYSSGWATIGEQLNLLRDQNSSLRQFGADQTQEVQAGLAALRAKHDSIHATLVNHGERQGRLESATTRLEAAQCEERRDNAIQREELEKRLGQLEEESPRCLEQIDHLRERFRALEESFGGWAVIREQLDLLRDQNSSLLQLWADRKEDVEAGSTALRAEHASIHATLVDHGERQGRLESALTRLKAAHCEERRGIEVRWEEFKATSFVKWNEIEALHERLQKIDDDHTGSLRRLQSCLDRVDAIGSDATDFRREFDSFRHEQDARRRDVLDQVERSRRDIGELRAELESRKSSPSHIASAPIDTRGNSMGSRLPTTPSVVAFAPGSRRFDFDALAQDLASDQLVGVGERFGINGPATCSAIPSTGPGIADPVASRLDTVEYKRFGEQFDNLMKSCMFLDASATARHLVAYSRDRIGESTLEHALWLRNLAFSLSLVGGRDEARELLHRALDICRLNSASDRVPHAVCLLDLSEFYSETGDRRSAKHFCEQALVILEANLGTNSPLRIRAQKCMARIEALDSHPEVMNTVSIST